MSGRWAIGVGAVAVALGWFVAYEPAVLAAVALVLATYKWPGIGLIGISYLGLVAGDYDSSLLRFGLLLLAAVSVARVWAADQLRRTVRFSAAVAAPILLAFLLAARAWGESSSGDAQLVGPVVALLVGSVWAARRAAQFVNWLGIGGCIFIAANTALLLVDGGEARFAGISGNPNRLVVGVAIFLPFSISLIRRSPFALRWLCALAMVLSACLIVVGAGSAQGLVLVAVSVVVSLSQLSEARSRWFLLGIGATAAMVIGWAGTDLATKLLVELRGDWSGRSGIWAAAADVLMREPILGTGSVHFSDISAGILDRSAHNAFLSISIWGGLSALALFTVSWVLALRRSIRVGGPTLLALAVGLLSTTAQSVELLPVIWLCWGFAIQAGCRQDVPLHADARPSADDGLRLVGAER